MSQCNITMNQKQLFEHLPAFVEKMRRENLSPAVIETFEYYYKKAISGEKGLLPGCDLIRIGKDEIKHIDHLRHFAYVGKKALKNCVVIILNGGLGTSMGLTGPKSLIEAKDGKTFLEIILSQTQNLNISLALMNSFNTHENTLSAVSRLSPSNIPLMFVQNKFPKILQKGFKPALWQKNPLLEWNPPGHGDIYNALYSSGVLDELINRGIIYAFIANCDNLAACLDESLLGYFVEIDAPIMMEVSDRTPSDMKGGHLAKTKSGQFILRESAQCPDEEIKTFSDINFYCFFNTNNLWINLNAFKDYFKNNNKILLPMILNSKTLDPRDETSPSVFQIETAMGSAISLFDGSLVVKVPRSRFFPVKKCNELLAIRSDYYLWTDQNHIIMNPKRKTDNLKINLDSVYFGKIDQFESRFKAGIPSLVDCESLDIKGDVIFEKNVRIVGKVKIENKSNKQAVIEEGKVIDSDIIY